MSKNTDRDGSEAYQGKRKIFSKFNPLIDLDHIDKKFFVETTLKRINIFLQNVLKNTVM